MRAIETAYKGYRFRSRLEARWAVFFDASKTRWFYEHEGFELPSGRYLPDFHLPTSGVFVEVKPGSPSPTEMRKAEDLLRLTSGAVFITNGLPENYGTLLHYAAEFTRTSETKVIRASEAILNFHSDGSPVFFLFAADEDGTREYWEHYFPSSKARFFISDKRYTPKWGTPQSRAFGAARSARFEFGETGA